MLKKIVLFLFAFTAAVANAAFLQVSDIPQVSARGGLVSTDDISRFSPFNLDQEMIISACYMLPYGISELNRQSINVSFPLFSRSILVSADNFGNDIYRENTLLIAYSVYRSESVVFAPAVQVNYLSSAENDYLAAAGGLFLLFKPVSQLEIISSALNIAATPIADESPEANFQISSKYCLEENIAILAGVEKDRDTPAVVKIGAEVTMLDKIRLAGGYNFEPALYTGGFDLTLGGWQFAYSLTYHEVLGISHSAGLIFTVK